MKVIIQGKELNLYQLVGRYELDPIEIENKGSFVFTIDIYREMTDLKQYFPKVYRYEFYRLQPSFSSDSSTSTVEGYDEEILVEDSSNLWSEKRMNTSEEALRFVLEKIKELFDYN